MRRLTVALSCSVALAFAGCTTEPKEEQVVVPLEGAPGQWPVARVVDHLKYGRILFYPEPEVSWTELVDLSLFDGFSPGMTGEQAVRAVGPADEYREVNGDRYWIYYRSAAQVAVAHKSMGSLFGGWWWRLEASLEPPTPPSTLFHSSVVQAIPQKEGRFSIKIMTRNGRPAVTALVEDGNVVKLDWIDNPGSRRRDVENEASSSSPL